VVIEFGFNDQAAWDDLSDVEQAARLEAERRRLTRYSRALTVLRQVLTRPPDATRTPAEPRRPRLSDEEFTGEIRAIAAWCRERRAKPVLLVWPLRGQLARDELTSKQRTLLDVAATDGMPVVNLIPVFRARGGAGLFADVVHASQAGHAAIADTLVPLLKELLASTSDGQD
jgi:lysophospholipase L1-like esterase